VIADEVHIGGALGKFAVRELRGKSVVVLDDRTAYGQGLAVEFEKGVRSAGGQVFRREFVSDKATDFSSVLLNLKTSGADVVFFGGNEAVAGPLLRQMRQLGIEAPVLGGDSLCSDQLSRLAGSDQAVGQIACAHTGGVDDAAKDSVTEFTQRYRKRFNADPLPDAPYSYDAVNVLVAAMVRAGSTDPKTYLPVLAETQAHRGVTGMISFDPKGDAKNGALTICGISDGRMVQVGVVR
jgi:branched-chain amino acid transport system substrate-binding protein